MGAAIFKFLIVHLMGFDWHAWVCFVFLFQKQLNFKKEYKVCKNSNACRNFWEGLSKRAVVEYFHGAYQTGVWNLLLLLEIVFEVKRQRPD